MVNLNEEFDAEVDGQNEVRPAGKYLSVLCKSEMVRNKKDTGDLLKMQFKIIDGPEKDNIIFDQLNWTNPNAMAVKLSKQKFAELTKACGKTIIRDTSQLHDIPVIVVTKIEKSDMGDQEKVIGFEVASVRKSTPKPKKAVVNDDQEEEDIPF